MEKLTLKLNGLDCANCANKIEETIRILDYVKSSNVDFVSQKLVVEIQGTTTRDKAIEDISKIATSIESGIKVKELAENDEEEHNDNISNEIIRIIIAGALFIISILIKVNFISVISVFLSYIIIGYDVLISAVKNIFKGKPFDEAFLMTVATIGAFCIGYYEEGVAVMLFYQVGELFQSLAVNRSRKSISQLMNIRPDFAYIKRGSQTIRVKPEEVKIGEVIVVKAGEKIPLDGRILVGSTSLDTSALTGESMPREISVGDEVLSGSVNLQGVIEIEVASEFKNSTVSKILDLVENASSKKAKTEKFISRFAKIYTPIVVIVAIILAIVPPLLLQGATFSEWLYRALIFLVVSCPCALVISVPLSFFGGVGGASRSGVLVKGANALEMLSRIETIAFDKTGTLTKGDFSVTSIFPSSISENKLLETTALVESYSNHPIALSIVKAYNGKLDKSSVSDLFEISGKGISAKVNGEPVLVGNKKLMDEKEISIPQTNAVGTIIYTAINNKYAGFIVVSDEIKKDSKKALEKLKALGINKTVMLTGDKKQVGEAIANSIGIDKAYTELLPADKVNVIESLIAENSKGKAVAFVGDGINDAPVLARADVGIAMGGVGSDSAIEAADIVLMTDEPLKIATAIEISRKTMRIVRQNIIFALSIKFAVQILGALGFATMWEAVFADVGVSLIAIFNSLRALKKLN